jgi:hypothetical protein
MTFAEEAGQGESHDPQQPRQVITNVLRPQHAALLDAAGIAAAVAARLPFGDHDGRTARPQCRASEPNEGSIR